MNANLEWCLSLQNDCCGVSTESGSDRVTILEFSILAISGDPVATALGTDLILKLRHHRKSRRNQTVETVNWNFAAFLVHPVETGCEWELVTF